MRSTWSLCLLSLSLSLSPSVSLLQPLRARFALAPRTLQTRAMPNGVKKENLPTKICVTCQRPFTWRKKWERCWDEVTTCSRSCNSKRRSSTGKHGGNGNALAEVSGSSSEFATVEAVIEEAKSIKIDEDESGHEYVTEVGCSDGDGEDEEEQSEEILDPKAAKKASKKALKAARRSKRMGSEDSIKEKQKPCDICSKKVDLLIRCQVDESKKWNMVCGKCWHDVSGGQVDGDSSHPYYKYGGLWKNRAAQQK